MKHKLFKDKPRVALLKYPFAFARGSLPIFKQSEISLTVFLLIENCNKREIYKKVATGRHNYDVFKTKITTSCLSHDNYQALGF